MTKSSCVSGLVKCFKKTAILDTSPVNCNWRICANDPFDRRSPVNRRADLRISEKSTSSPEKTPLSVDPTDVGVESPDRGRSSSKKPSTAIIDLPERSSCRLLSCANEAIHRPTPGESAPGATRISFSNESCGRSNSVNASGRVVGEMKENVESRVRLDISARNAFN